MKKLKTISFVIMLVFIATISGVMPANADETLVTPNKLIVFKIGDSNYYTQEIGSDKVDKVKMDAAPLIKQSRTFVPVRFLGNALGVNDNNIKWDNSTRTAALRGNAELKLTIGHKTIVKDGKEKAIDVAPYIIPPGRTVLPARYVAEGLGFKVDWDSQNSLVVVYPEGAEKPDIDKILEEIKPATPPAGERRYHSDIIEDVYYDLTAKGYTVELPKRTTSDNPDKNINDYGEICICMDRDTSDVEQCKKDIHEQVLKFADKEIADWVVKGMNFYFTTPHSGGGHVRKGPNGFVSVGVATGYGEVYVSLAAYVE